MPTEILHHLTVEGAPEDLARLRADDSIWRLEPWILLYTARVRKRGGGLDVRYRDDFKRPGPSIADVAARYPALTILHETEDEFGQTWSRSRYAGGALVDFANHHSQ